jgi:hypothetical protein
MGMIELLQKEYFSKADTFLLPLTGIKKTESVKIESFLFWREYSIEDYKLTVCIEDYDEAFMESFMQQIDENSHVTECFTSGSRTIFIVDISEWAQDIELFLIGKYSKLSDAAKKRIIKYHTFDGNSIKLWIKAILKPDEPRDLLDGMTPIQYVCHHYEFDEDEMNRIGEIGPVYKADKETLLTDYHDVCQYVS